VKNPLDPFLLKLAMEYTDDADLTRRINDYFQVLEHAGYALMTCCSIYSLKKNLNKFSEQRSGQSAAAASAGPTNECAINF
jgi:hypothetical protein